MTSASMADATELNEVKQHKKQVRDFKRKLRRRKAKQNVFAIPLMIILTVACMISVFTSRLEYNEKQSELTALHEKAAALEAENASYDSILSEQDERTYMERIATEKLGYAYPDERRFYDTTRS